MKNVFFGLLVFLAFLVMPKQSLSFDVLDDAQIEKSFDYNVVVDVLAVDAVIVLDVDVGNQIDKNIIKTASFSDDANSVDCLTLYHAYRWGEIINTTFNFKHIDEWLHILYLYN